MNAQWGSFNPQLEEDLQQFLIFAQQEPIIFQNISELANRIRDEGFIKFEELTQEVEKNKGKESAKAKSFLKFLPSIQNYKLQITQKPITELILASKKSVIIVQDFLKSKLNPYKPMPFGVPIISSKWERFCENIKTSYLNLFNELRNRFPLTSYDNIADELKAIQPNAYPIYSKKFAIELILQSSDQEARNILIYYLKQYMPFPISMNDFGNLSQSILNKDAFLLVDNLPSICSISTEPIDGKSTLLNKLFPTCFHLRNQFATTYEDGSVDAQICKSSTNLNINTFVIYDFKNKYDKQLLTKILLISNCLVIHYKNEKNEDLKNLINEYKIKMPIILIKRDETAISYTTNIIENLVMLNITHLKDGKVIPIEIINLITSKAVENFKLQTNNILPNEISFWEANSFFNEIKKCWAFLSEKELHKLVPMYIFYCKKCSNNSLKYEISAQSTNRYLSEKEANIANAKMVYQKVKPIPLHPLIIKLCLGNKNIAFYTTFLDNLIKRFSILPLNIEQVKQNQLYQELLIKESDNTYIKIDFSHIWREIMFTQKYNEIAEKHNYCQSYAQYISEENSFELWDGNNKYFPYNFIREVLTLLNNSKPICVVTVFGPEKSGKSTLLNALFGCQFAVSSQRCSMGIYCTVLKTDFPYDLLILDTEGIQSPERARKSKDSLEIERKLLLFCLAISNISLLVVSKTILREQNETLDICCNAFDELGKAKICEPKLYIILNQNSDLNVQNYLSNFKNYKNQSSIAINENNIFVLPSTPILQENYTYQNYDIRFITEISKLRDKILNDTSFSNHKNLIDWIDSVHIIKKEIDRIGNLLSYVSINEKKIEEEAIGQLDQKINNIQSNLIKYCQQQQNLNPSEYYNQTFQNKISEEYYKQYINLQNLQNQLLKELKNPEHIQKKFEIKAEYVRLSLIDSHKFDIIANRENSALIFQNVIENKLKDIKDEKQLREKFDSEYSNYYGSKPVNLENIEDCLLTKNYFLHISNNLSISLECYSNTYEVYKKLKGLSKTEQSNLIIDDSCIDFDIYSKSIDALHQSCQWKYLNISIDQTNCETMQNVLMHKAIDFLSKQLNCILGAKLNQFEFDVFDLENTYKSLITEFQSVGLSLRYTNAFKEWLFSIACESTAEIIINEKDIIISNSRELYKSFYDNGKLIEPRIEPYVSEDNGGTSMDFFTLSIKDLTERKIVKSLMSMVKCYFQKLIQNSSSYISNFKGVQQIVESVCAEYSVSLSSNFKNKISALDNGTSKAIYIDNNDIIFGKDTFQRYNQIKLLFKNKKICFRYQQAPDMLNVHNTLFHLYMNKSLNSKERLNEMKKYIIDNTNKDEINNDINQFIQPLMALSCYENISIKTVNYITNLINELNYEYNLLGFKINLIGKSKIHTFALCMATMLTRERYNLSKIIDMNEINNYKNKLFNHFSTIMYSNDLKDVVNQTCELINSQLDKYFMKEQEAICRTEFKNSKEITPKSIKKIIENILFSADTSLSNNAKYQYLHSVITNPELIIHEQYNYFLDSMIFSRCRSSILNFKTRSHQVITNVLTNCNNYNNTTLIKDISQLEKYLEQNASKDLLESNIETEFIKILINKLKLISKYQAADILKVFLGIYSDKNSISNISTQASDKIINDFRVLSVGCKMACVLCKKLCDEEGKHDIHKCNYHYPRCFSGSYVKSIYKYPAFYICNESSEDSIIEYKNQRFSFSEFKKKFSNWDFDCSLQYGNNYREKWTKLWKLIGKDVCDKYKITYKDCPTYFSKYEIVFLCDCTGSMTDYINKCKKTISDVMIKYSSEYYQIKFKFAFVGYRDHPQKNDSGFGDWKNVVQYHQLDNAKNTTDFINSISGDSGGDTCEAVIDGMNCCITEIK